VTTRKVWMGSTGPFLYDDSVEYIDEDGVIAPDNQCAIATDGQVVVQSAPTSPVHVVRKQDLDDAVGNIADLDARVTALESGLATANARIDQNYNSIVALNSKFATSTFDMYWSGWGGVNGHGIVTYYKIDRLICVIIPRIESASSNTYIWLGNFPTALVPPTQISVPLTVYTAAGSYDLSPASYSGDPFWQFHLDGGIKNGPFPTTGLKVLLAQQFIYEV
jgi:hypothetical protein